MIQLLETEFVITSLTDEDKNRTDLYKKISKTSDLINSEKTDLTEFLSSLKMSLSINNRSLDGQERAIQLINKTNQFNLNGERITEELVARTINAGGSLFTGSLTDSSEIMEK